MKVINVVLLWILIFFSCQPESVLPKFSIEDYDGNVYKTIDIGKQTWMAENLRTTHLNNGAKIPLAENWNGLKSPAYCWYNNDSIKYKSVYGPLYNAYAVNTGKLCPSGWHVPTSENMNTLITYLGGASVAGGKLKSLSLWNSPNTGATNETGFNALACGFRCASGTCFLDINLIGYYWCSTIFDATRNSSFAMDCTSEKIYIVPYVFNDGFPVRCIKD